jgi:hypothetical protein
MNEPPFSLTATSAIQPELLEETHPLQFQCQPGIACFNHCCRQADITLTPYDIIRLKRRLQLESSEFLQRYTVPFRFDSDGLPGVKLKTDSQGTCLQLAGEQGCGVYSDRPSVCRYYPLALLNLHPKGTADAHQRYSLIKEAHCRGHDQPQQVSISAYRHDQGVDAYDDYNQEWYQLILKKKSAGPTVGKPPEQSLALFFMASYDLDRFRRFVMSDSFQRSYQLASDLYDRLQTSDEALLDFACRFLRQVLFGERSIEEAADAWERRVTERDEVWTLRREAALAHQQALDDARYRDSD